MKFHWFKKVGWIYVPVSIIGYNITLFTIWFCYNAFTGIHKNSHSLIETLYGAFPYFICAFAILFWIASNTLKPSGTNDGK